MAASARCLDTGWGVFRPWALPGQLDGCLSSATGTWPLYHIDRGRPSAVVWRGLVLALTKTSLPWDLVGPQGCVCLNESLTV